jgi:zinc transporter 9
MHSYHELMHPSLQEITWHVWGVLGVSFLLDGQVLVKASKKFLKDKKKGDSVWSHLQKTRDPFNLAMLLEDGAACTGVIIALAGISLSHTYQNPIYDGLGGVGISCLLGAVGIILAGFNHRFLLGQAVDAEIVKGIHDIIMKQRSIDGIRSVQTQWIGPDSFSYKAEVDFDGTYIAAKLLPSYLSEFSKAKLEIEHELRVLLSFYTEDVLRMVEQEVRSIEAEIRVAYPGAEYIELEPMSKDLDEMILDESKTEELRNIELEALRSHEASLQSSDYDVDDMIISDTDEYNTTTTPSSTTTTTTKYWDDTKKF